MGRGQGSAQDAPRGSSHRFCSDLRNNISMLLTGTPHSRMIQVRPEKTLYYILFYLSLRLVCQMDTISGIHPPLQDTSFFTFYIYAIITLPIPYYNTCVIHGIIAHKQTNLFYG